MVIKIDDSLFNKLGIWWLTITLLNQPIGYILEIFNFPYYIFIDSAFVYFCLLMGVLLVVIPCAYVAYRARMLVIVLTLVMILLSIFIYPENRDASIPILRMMLMSVLAYYAISYINDYEKILKIITRIGYVIIPLSVYARIFLRGQVYRDYANFAIMLFPYVFAFCFLTIKKVSAVNILYFVAGMYFILMFGNRTTFLLLLFGLFLVIYKRSPSKLVIALLVLFVVLFMFESQIENVLNSVITYLYSLFSNNNVYSRTLSVFQSQNLLDLSGREAFFQNAFELIKKSPIIGNGVGSDMIYNYDRFATNSMDISLTGAYSHNGFLEMSVEFGVLFSILVWGCIIYKCILNYLTIKYEDERFFLFLTMLLYGVIRTFLGYPYWYNWYFWGAIAFLFMRNNKST